MTHKISSTFDTRFCFLPIFAGILRSEPSLTGFSNVLKSHVTFTRANETFGDLHLATYEIIINVVRTYILRIYFAHMVAGIAKKTFVDPANVTRFCIKSRSEIMHASSDTFGFGSPICALLSKPCQNFHLILVFNIQTFDANSR